MKKEYMKPEQRVVMLHHRTQLLSGSPVNKTLNNVGLNENITGGSGTARSRSLDDDWEDDDWDE